MEAWGQNLKWYSKSKKKKKALKQYIKKFGIIIFLTPPPNTHTKAFPIPTGSKKKKTTEGKKNQKQTQRSKGSDNPHAVLCK